MKLLSTNKVKEIFGKVTTTIKTRWTGLSKTARIIIIAVAAVIIVSLIVVLILSSITRYAVLYSGASTEETADETVFETLEESADEAVFEAV